MTLFPCIFDSVEPEFLCYPMPIQLQQFHKSIGEEYGLGDIVPRVSHTSNLDNLDDEFMNF